jgi:lysophospholipase L1-like esterase
MKRLFFFAAILVPWTAVPAADPGKTPAVNPAFAPIEEVAGLPRVLLLGDSISMGYTLPVRELLKGKANILRPSVNCSSTGNALENLDVWLGKGKWDLVHFNFGLHDAKLPPEGIRHSSPEVYEKNLLELVKKLKASGARLVWATTTPVPNGGIISPTRRFGDIDHYNVIARKVMEENGVLINDLNRVITPRVAALQNPNDVHFSREGSALLARAVAGSIEKALSDQKGDPVKPSL